MGTENDDPVVTGGGKKLFPRKILRYFPLIPRLQRLYMRASTSSLMRWHKEERVRDGKMRHPADSLAWQHVDGEYRPVPMGVQPVQRNRAPNLEGPQIQDQQPIRSINILVCVIGSN